MKKGFIAMIASAWILFLLTMIQVQTAAATALGLADGSYNIVIDLPGTTHDAQGTMTIGVGQITAFDVLDVDGSHWVFPGGDTIIANDQNNFSIRDTVFPFATQTTMSLGVGNIASETFASGEGGSGSWLATRIPEPASITLFGLGAVGLWIWRRRQM
jgi:PEP-CTERM motif-containing protein